MCTVYGAERYQQETNCAISVSVNRDDAKTDVPFAAHEVDGSRSSISYFPSGKGVVVWR